MKGKSGLPLIVSLVKKVFPAVENELARWKRQAEQIPDGVLRAQALASLEKKKFHCQGGGVYALYPTAEMESAVRFIVALQTISDYLDNLCDRAGVEGEAAFRQLHLAMADAVDPYAPTQDYYACYPQSDDGEYLQALVGECRREVAGLASFVLVKDKMAWLVSMYAELQVRKHVQPNLREEKLLGWAAPLVREFPGISVWEFCAAAGSTLGMFLLFCAAQAPGLSVSDADALLAVYFPWVCGLHILLDYFIDAEEDKVGGDFNFTACYRDAGECRERFAFFIRQSLRECSKLPRARFHSTVVRGLLAMYFSDPKAACGANKKVSRKLIVLGGNQAVFFRGMCLLLRKAGRLQ